MVYGLFLKKSRKNLKNILTFFFDFTILTLHLITYISFDVKNYMFHSPVAQLAEQVAVNHWVRGSSPRGGVFFYLRKDSMARRCEICGKGPQSGNKVSKSLNHTKRVWKPNLVKLKTEIAGDTFTVKMCTRCLRSGYIKKKV